MKSRQSKSLPEAVAEYKSRYGRPPPPGFDKWYQFAVKNDVQLIDEYDYLTRSVEPYWKVSPRVLRDYVDQALRIDPNALNTLVVQGGNATLENPGFQHLQLVELIKPIVSFLVHYFLIAYLG